MILQAYDLMKYAIEHGDADGARLAAEVLAHCVFLICPDLRTAPAFHNVTHIPHGVCYRCGGECFIAQMYCSPCHRQVMTRVQEFPK